MEISTHVLALMIGLAYPLYFVLTHQKTNQRIKNDGKFRLLDYKQTIFIFWVLTLLVIVNSCFESSIHLNFYPDFNTVGVIVTVLILIFIGLQIAVSKVSTLEKAESIIEKMKDNYHYLPKSKQEFVWFNLLSLSAGICEEIIFRLFMFLYLQEVTNLVIAFLLTNIIFALTHIGTGKQNMMGAFILGVLFTAMFYFSNNIWLPILLHGVIDISAGFLGYYAHRFKKKTTNMPKEDEN